MPTDADPRLEGRCSVTDSVEQALPPMASACVHPANQRAAGYRFVNVLRAASAADAMLISS
jgi:hypothetical protein